MTSFFQKLSLFSIVLLAGCSNTLDDLLFRLVPHPQEPDERTYEIRAVEFINRRDGTKLAGELTYPSSNGKLAAFVLLSGHRTGSPPADRNNDITGHKYFLVISHLLTERGYAILRFDNRGVGASSGDYRTATDEDFAADAAAALRWLREKSGMELRASGFLGHSQGGIKALLAASHEKPDYVVALGSLRIESSKEFSVRQGTAVNTARGMGASDIEDWNQQISSIIEILQTSDTLDEARIRLREYAIGSGESNEEEIQAVVDVFGNEWWFNDVRLDYVSLIKSYDGPVLALYGSNDLLVSASANEAPVRNMLAHPKSEVFTFDGLNHLFQESKKGTGPREYWEIQTTIEESVIEKIDGWTTLVLDEVSQQKRP